VASGPFKGQEQKAFESAITSTISTQQSRKETFRFRCAEQNFSRECRSTPEHRRECRLLLLRSPAKLNVRVAALRNSKLNSDPFIRANPR
jgi:hypothetical protein